MTAVPASELQVAWGVSFDSPIGYVAAAETRPIPQAKLPVALSKLPSAVLVPRFNERVRTDFGCPPHPRGTGCNWPPEAEVSVEFGCGRLPLGLAWTLVEQEREWHWNSGDEQYRLSPFSALAAGVRDAVGHKLPPDGDRRITVVIPNNWQEKSQQRLIDALHAENVSARLLWRPIAAALAWSEVVCVEELIRSASPNASLSQVLVLYVGYDSLELTILELVRHTNDGHDRILPGRKRPDPRSCLRTSLGYDALFARRTGDARSTIDIARLWQDTWLNPPPSNLILRSPRTSGVSGGRPPPRDSAFRFVVADSEWRDWDKIDDWCRSWSRQIRDCRVSAVVVVGAVANATLENGSRFVDELLRKLGCQHSPCWIEGQSLPRGVLAQGAAIYTAKVLTGIPTHLDTLPRLRLVVTRYGEPCWIDLLTPEHQYVDGGKAWHRPEPVRNLTLSPNSREFRLAVHHEEFAHVREIVCPLPTIVTKRELMNLFVTVEPAQGNARLEVKPEVKDLFQRRRIIVDWRRMNEYRDVKGRPAQPESYLENIPRIFPRLLPRSASESRWRSALPCLQNCLDAFSQGRSQVYLARHLESLCKQLQQPDQLLYPREATAVDSEGRPPLSDTSFLARFIKEGMRHIHSGSDKTRSLLTRAFAYLSVDDEKFAHDLVAQLCGTPKVTDQDLLNACGQCLRASADIYQLALALTRELDRSGLETTIYWWKAMARVLRYRECATAAIPSDLALQISGLALERFKSELAAGNCNYVFRFVSLIIVYLLRRRAYEDSYLEPSSVLAESIKSSFRLAQTAVKRGQIRMIGGSVDLGAQLQLMIDYVDRRGIGNLEALP